MAVKQKPRQQTVVVEPGTVLADVLDQANDNPVTLERGGVRYRVERDPLTPAKPRDPEEFRAMLRRTAGTLAGVDGEELKRDLREQREQDSSGRPA